ncbi:proline-rich receptor-like protein kinase PERK9 [Oryza sativa Japonica Group]|uniref:proline-rich receptor-like protein kinase PERK9 n=1 Tax=Oryza sativa subsp. japonica TaxID=39947 RepID=UPI00339D019D
MPTPPRRHRLQVVVIRWLLPRRPHCQRHRHQRPILLPSRRTTPPPPTPPSPPSPPASSRRRTLDRSLPPEVLTTPLPHPAQPPRRLAPLPSPIPRPQITVESTPHKPTTSQVYKPDSSSTSPPQAGCINPPHPGLPLDHHPHPAAAFVVDSASPCAAHVHAKSPSPTPHLATGSAPLRRSPPRSLSRRTGSWPPVLRSSLDAVGRWMQYSPVSPPSLRDIPIYKSVLGSGMLLLVLATRKLGFKRCESTTSEKRVLILYLPMVFKLLSHKQRRSEVKSYHWTQAHSSSGRQVPSSPGYSSLL